MISYEVYKIVHVVSVIAFFSLLSWGIWGQSKTGKILAKVFLLLVFVGGMGLMARLGIAHNSIWPQWVLIKVGVWLLVGVIGIMLTGRLRALAVPGIFLLLSVVGIAVWAAVTKPVF